MTAGRSTVTSSLAWVLMMALLAPFLAGCPVRWQRLSINDPIRPADVAFIQPGKTTLTEIVEKLGVPDVMTDVEHGGAAVRYRFLDVKYFRIDFLWGLRFVFPLLYIVPGASPSFVLGGGGGRPDEFEVLFDPAWIVRGYAFDVHASTSEFIIWPFE
jgi:hypothetical protein